VIPWEERKGPGRIPLEIRPDVQKLMLPRGATGQETKS
jgi:hypothetical protein